jgi:hypothetical protein
VSVSTAQARIGPNTTLLHGWLSGTVRRVSGIVLLVDGLLLVCEQKPELIEPFDLTRYRRTAR